MRQLYLLLIVLVALGCSSAPADLKPPDIDAAGAAREAMTQYDTDRDGALAVAELKSSPALLKAMSRIDSNRDQKLSEDEIAARIRSWSARGTAIADVKCRVLLDGQPLSGAEVVLEPERFLGSEIHAARGETDAQGYARLALAPEHLPDPSLTGASPGLYVVRITSRSGQRPIPVRYNQNSELGEEVADDPSPEGAGILEYRLQSS